MKRIWVDEKKIGAFLIMTGLISLGFTLFGTIVKGRSGLAGAEIKKQSPASFHHSEHLPEHLRVACKVLTVYDGDTLACDLNRDGSIQKPREEIRLLGVDSPEMHYSRKNATYQTAHPLDEPFAKEASRWLTKQVNQKTVYLEFDVRPADQYGRSLAYVFLAPQMGLSLNEHLLETGYATLLFIGPNRRYEQRFQLAETRARKLKKGLWR